MAKKKLNPLEDPPKSSSTDNDDEVETQSEEEEEGEEQISDDSSSEEEEQDDDLMSPVIILPPSKKPKTSGSKNPPAAAVTVASPSKQRSTKRSSEEICRKEKRSKKKTPLFQRLWSEEDEIVLLQGMIDFDSERGKSPYEDTDRFYDFIKQAISFEASKYQTADKIRSLKKKYLKKVKSGVESMLKAHDVECFKLSEFIWGPNGMALKSNVKPQEKEVESDGEKEEEEDREVLVDGDFKCPGVVRASDWFEESFLVGSIGSLGVGEGFVKRKWSMVGVETKKKMEEKWKVLQAKEMELVLEKTDFMREVGSVIADAS